MKPIPVKVEQLPARLGNPLKRYFKRHPAVAALETELKFGLNHDQWIVGDAAGRRAFGRTPLTALRHFADEFLPRRL